MIDDYFAKEMKRHGPDLHCYGFGWLVVRWKADCLAGGMLSVGIFLRDPCPYLRELRRKKLKTPNG